MPRSPKPGNLKKAVHPSISALIGEYGDQHGTSDPKLLIRILARNRVDHALRCGWEGPPFCPMALCSLFGIRCFEVDHDIGGDGRILPGKDGKPKIEYLSGRLPVRQRFTLFHEFAHTLFPDFGELLPHHHKQPSVVRPEEKQFERLCDIGASEMLFPRGAFVDDLLALGSLDLKKLLSLASRYSASPEATAFRIAEFCDAHPLNFVFVTDQKGKFGGRGPLWVSYSVPNAQFKGFIPSGTEVPFRSVAVDCFRNANGVSEIRKEVWYIRGAPRSYRVQAVRLPDVSGILGAPKVGVLLLPSGFKGGCPLLK